MTQREGGREGRGGGKEQSDRSASWYESALHSCVPVLMQFDAILHVESACLGLG